MNSKQSRFYSQDHVRAIHECLYVNLDLEELSRKLIPTIYWVEPKLLNGLNEDLGTKSRQELSGFCRPEVGKHQAWGVYLFILQDLSDPPAGANHKVAE